MTYLLISSEYNTELSIPSFRFHGKDAWDIFDLKCNNRLMKLYKKLRTMQLRHSLIRRNDVERYCFTPFNYSTFNVRCWTHRCQGYGGQAFISFYKGDDYAAR